MNPHRLCGVGLTTISLLCGAISFYHGLYGYAAVLAFMGGLTVGVAMATWSKFQAETEETP